MVEREIASQGTKTVLSAFPHHIPRTIRMPWKEPAERHNDAIIEAIHAASRHISSSIEKGFKHMADAQAQALADLQTAIATIGDEIAKEIGALQKALSASSQPDDSGAIEAAVTNLNDLAAKLKESRPVDTTLAPAAPVPTPAAG